MALIIQDHLSSTDQKLTQYQLLVLPKKIRHSLWIWHTYMDYILA